MGPTTIKAIETRYNGFKFRSRLEARWAVFFDTLKVKYEYEKEGYNLGEAGYYLPDFWLPGLKLFVEIKGQEPTNFERKKARYLADLSKNNVLILAGNPGPPWPVFEEDKEDGSHHLKEVCSEYEGELFVGNLFQSYLLFADFEDALELYAFDSLAESLLKPTYEEHPDWFSEPIPSFDLSLDIMNKLIELDCQYYRKKHNKEHPKWEWGLWIDKQNFTTYQPKPDSFVLKLNEPLQCVPYPGIGTESLLNAYKAAKQARFEFGETPHAR